MDDPARIHPRIERLMRDLDGLRRTVHDRETFEDQTIHLDGREFINCTFRRCTFTITLGIFMFRGEQQIADCEWQLLGPTRSTFELLQYVQNGAFRAHLSSSWYWRGRSAFALPSARLADESHGRGKGQREASPDSTGRAPAHRCSRRNEPGQAILVGLPMPFGDLPHRHVIELQVVHRGARAVDLADAGRRAMWFMTTSLPVGPGCRRPPGGCNAATSLGRGTGRRCGRGGSRPKAPAPNAVVELRLVS
jgi:hypothetical protein